MIKTVKGNVLDVERGFIVHGCNCYGVMGSGVAKAVKDKYPEAFAAYKQRFDEGSRLVPGYPGLVVGEIIPVQVGPEKWIVNAMTQDYYNKKDEPWKRHVDYEGVAQCFAKIRTLAIDRSTTELLPVAFPAIGSDRGGGSWAVISAIIDETLPDSEGFVKLLYVL